MKNVALLILGLQDYAVVSCEIGSRSALVPFGVFQVAGTERGRYKLVTQDSAYYWLKSYVGISYFLISTAFFEMMVGILIFAWVAGKLYLGEHANVFD
jgi:hypothetical protein